MEILALLDFAILQRWRMTRDLTLLYKRGANSRATSGGEVMCRKLDLCFDRLLRFLVMIQSTATMRGLC